ncbi:hypothetical protein V6N11_019061 [Hibiscus sabdariffa]|uniref:Glycerophosphodiester phosphodiesterase n=2 Tax=Hibiscus sabdariffa TaxID=183260 RepID=A0ABR2R206_9ROSI
MLGYRKKDVGLNKLQIREYVPTIKTTRDRTKVMGNESQEWGNSLKAINSTRQITWDKVQNPISPIRGMMQGSDEILGLTMKAGYQGIVSDFPFNQQAACQNKTNALSLAG